MQVILIQDVDNLGGRNELVTVKNGYARNYLIPQKFAVEANPSNLKQHEERLKVIAKKEAAMLAELEDDRRTLAEQSSCLPPEVATHSRFQDVVRALDTASVALNSVLQAGRGNRPLAGV